MKNIYILPTDKSSKLLISKRNHLQFLKDNSSLNPNNHFEGIYQNIYITNDEEIKEGDYFHLDMSNNEHPDEIHKMSSNNWSKSKSGGINFNNNYTWTSCCKKIILTTDQDLINDGVQAIDDDFLEWIVKNPSCEEVEVKLVALNEFGSEITVNSYGFEKFGYKIITPKEESKQETSVVEDLQDIANHLKKTNAIHKNQELEEAAKNYAEEYKGEEQDPWFDFMEGAKWQQERSYSEDDLREAFKGGGKMAWTDINQEIREAYYYDFQEWFEQFKNKT